MRSATADASFACGTLPGAQTRVNIQVLRRRSGRDRTALEKYAKVGALVGGMALATAKAIVVGRQVGIQATLQCVGSMMPLDIKSNDLAQRVNAGICSSCTFDRNRLPGDLLAGRAKFEVALADYGVKGMKGVVGAKVSETISVKLSFTASSHTPEMAMNPCNPCGGKKKMNPCNPCGE